MTTTTITITVSTTIKTIVEDATNPQSTQRLVARTDILAFGQECDFEAFCIIVSHLFSQTNDDYAKHFINSHGRAANDHNLLLV
jgi:hypothetical protein